jgi:hypothetical protein
MFKKVRGFVKHHGFSQADMLRDALERLPE